MLNSKYFYMIHAKDNVTNKVDIEKMEVVSRIPVARSAMCFGIKEDTELTSMEEGIYTET